MPRNIWRASAPPPKVKFPAYTRINKPPSFGAGWKCYEGEGELVNQWVPSVVHRTNLQGQGKIAFPEVVSFHLDSWAVVAGNGIYANVGVNFHAVAGYVVRHFHFLLIPICAKRSFCLGHTLAVPRKQNMSQMY